jgi:hypothetical protein
MSRFNKLGVKTMSKTLTTHRQRNWKEYNNALKERASFQFWLSREVIEGWEKVERKGKRGYPFLDSEIAIMFFQTISQLFHFPLRQREGFVRSLFSLSSRSLPFPSFPTLCRGRMGEWMGRKGWIKVHLCVEEKTERDWSFV